MINDLLILVNQCRDFIFSDKGYLTNSDIYGIISGVSDGANTHPARWFILNFPDGHLYGRIR